MIKYLTRLLMLSLLCLTIQAKAQMGKVECGYTDAPPTWVQVTNCTTVARNAPIITDLIIEGLDTTRIYMVTNQVAGKYMTIQHTYIPSNSQCVLITVQKKVRCR